VNARFPGLDSLRFWAALLVVIGHVPLTQASRGLPAPTFGALSYRAAPAVSFFFTLSGFLITHLLLAEAARSSRIDVRAFYVRRVLRIWPLYYFVIGFGLLFYNVVLPVLGIHYPVAYRPGEALLLYVFFLPNLMNSLFTVGGILNPTWSIGVEEQFYLAWAPLLRRWPGRVPWLAGAALLIFLAVSWSNDAAVFGQGWVENFVGQLEFHFMAAGALAAWGLRCHRVAVLEWPCFSSRRVQGLLWGLLAALLLLGDGPLPHPLIEVLLLLLFPWLIVETAVNPRRAIDVAWPWTERLGEVSYGIYMLHMIAVYSVTAVFLQSGVRHAPAVLYVTTFYGAVVALTLVLSYLSWRCLERPVLKLKAGFQR
jgi:peptidoglycan/LPS O-acetylase OafA/YrhL